MKRFLLFLFFIIFVWGLNFGQTMSEPINVSNSANTDSKWGQVAFGPDGKIHIVWEELIRDSAYSDIYYISYDGTNWDGPVNLSQSSERISWRPYICTNENGGVFVVWDQGKTHRDGVCFFREYDPVRKEWLADFRVSTLDFGGGEPYVAADSRGNVYITWHIQGRGKSYTRSRINGQWEDILRLNSTRSEQTGIVCADNDDIWATWLEKRAGPYAVYWSKRTRNTDWTQKKFIPLSGGSATHPHIDAGPNNVPVVTYCHIKGEESPKGRILICTLDEVNNPREAVAEAALQHFSRIAIDSYGNKHVAWQIGPGGGGTGIKYRHNIGGKWNPVQSMRNSAGKPELPGISADRGGNVAVVWSASVRGSNKEIWLSTLYPVLVLYPPINLNMNISISSLKETPQIAYDLSWENYPENPQSKIKGYRIYKRENSGQWELLLPVSKNTFSASFTFSGAERRIQFGIKTVSIYNTEGPMAIFGMEE